MKRLRPPQSTQPEDLTKTTTQNLADILQLIDEAVLRGNKKGYLYQLLATSGWTSCHWLHTIRQPTLVLMGRSDQIVPEVNGTLLTKLLPNARMQTFPGGHLFLLMQPEPIAAQIDAFLEQSD